MSRSLDSTSLTTRPSMAIAPAVISSSPASIRSSVDLPQPDGPTRTMNSPSRMSKLMPWMTFVWPKDFSMFWNDTVAIARSRRSGFHSTGGQSADHVALERVIDRRRRQRVDEAGRHQQFPRGIVGRQEAAQGNAERHVPVVGQQQERIE